MIEAICPKCGHRYYGWVLLQPNNQSCPKCGVELLTTETGNRAIERYSHITDEEYKIKLPNKSILEPDTIMDITSKE